MISNAKIPDSKIAREAAELVRQHESEMLFNHSVRVFLFGAMKGIRQNLKFDSELLFIAALFHDLGLVDAYHTETKRFEVDGADAAREFLKSHGIPELKADLVWEAIALHTTPGIPQYMRPEIALTNAGVLVDVVGIGYDEYTPEQRSQVIADFPRCDFKNEFIEVQTCSALKKPLTTLERSISTTSNIATRHFTRQTHALGSATLLGLADLLRITRCKTLNWENKLCPGAFHFRSPSNTANDPGLLTAD